jgi:hypothetical protein
MRHDNTLKKELRAIRRLSDTVQLSVGIDRDRIGPIPDP